MHSTERQQFEEELAVLFGGFPQFLTPPRVEAYWRGLQKMSMSIFKRCVEQALGEEGPDKLPTLNTLWQISKNLRAPAKPQAQTEQPQFDGFHGFGQRALYVFLRRKGGSSEASLRRMIDVKNNLVCTWRNMPAAERGEVTEWRDVFLAAFEKLWEPMPPEEIERHRQSFIRTGHAADFSEGA